MVELFVFAPGEEIDDKEFAEVMLRVGYDLARPVVLDAFGEARGACRFAVRRAAFEAKTPVPVNPLSVRCPSCAAEPWDPCVNRGEVYMLGPTLGPKVAISLVTHAGRRAAATGRVLP